MRRIGVVTVGRSDYGLYRSVLEGITADPELELDLLVAGMHLPPLYGSTVKGIEADGYPISARVEMLLASDSPEGVAKSMGLGTVGFSQELARLKPDLLVLLGDRFEMLSAAMAALPFKLPLAHIHGGELTRGQIDDPIRHCLTKLSHLHFVSTEAYAARVIQLGEEPWRVTVSGAPGLDNLSLVELLGPRELEKKLDLSLKTPPLLVTFHPVTLEYEQTGRQVENLLAALEGSELPIIFTLPNSDTSRMTIVQKIEAFARNRPSVWIRDNLGVQSYFSLMKAAAAMVGNSSSGVIEAPSFKLPVVNIGTRQEGRLKAANVLDVGYGREEILAGIKKATSSGFKTGLAGLKNPHGDGRAGERIVSRLKSVALDQRLIFKKFYDLVLDQVWERPDWT